MAIINILLQGGTESIFIVFVVFVLGLFTCTFFVSFHADATESIQIIFLLDEYFAEKELGGNAKKEFNDSVIKKMKLHKPFAAKISQLYNAKQWGDALIFMDYGSCFIGKVGSVLAASIILWGRGPRVTGSRIR